MAQARAVRMTTLSGHCFHAGTTVAVSAITSSKQTPSFDQFEDHS